jgi:type IV pilus assembly protein PilM
MNPFRNISDQRRDFNPEWISDIAPSMAVAVGLAIRKVGDA